MRAQLISETALTGQLLVQVLSAFDDKQLNTVPFEGSWTAAQVAEHIWKAGDCGVVYGPSAPTQRAADEKVNAIKALFQDYNAKFNAPEMIIPGNAPHTQTQVMEHIHQIWDKLTTAANTVDLNEECLAFEVPGFGPFTRLEWIKFINIHTRRHIRQLENIQAHVLKEQLV